MEDRVGIRNSMYYLLNYSVNLRLSKNNKVSNYFFKNNYLTSHLKGVLTRPA